MKMIKQIKVHGKIHLARPCQREVTGNTAPKANYMGTGLALFAVVDKDENLVDLLQKLEVRKSLNKIKNEKKKSRK